MKTRFLQRALAVLTLAMLVVAATPVHAAVIGQLGVLDDTANGGINPVTGVAWVPGDTYRLAFVSSVKTAATSTDITTYNTFVQGLADAAGLGDGVWNLAGSTATVDARDNTGTNPGVDGTGVGVFLMDGITKIADNNAELWNGLDTGLTIDEYGVDGYSGNAHTGSETDGTAVGGDGSRVLGGSSEDPPRVRVGRIHVGGQWMRIYNTAATTELPVYAISEPLIVQSAFDATDFDEDGDSDLIDINALTAAADLAAGLPAALAGEQFDLTGDETVDGADLDKWLTDAATINGLGSPYLKGDTNIDGDVDVWAFDGSGDAQVLSSNLGTMTDMVWGDGDFNGDGDVDVWAFDGSGDAQQLSSNLGSTSDVGPDAAAGTAEALYYQATGELAFDIGTGVGVVGIMADGMMHGAVNEGSIFGTPGQNGNNILAYFNTAGLPTGEDSVGIVLPSGLTEADLSFSYTPVGGATTVVPVTIIPVPEPSTIAMLMVVGLIGVCWRRRRG